MDILYNICEIAASVCDNAFELWFLLSFFGSKNKKFHILGYIGIVVLKTAIGEILPLLGYNGFLLSTAIFIGTSLIYCRIFLNGSWIKHILASVVSDLIILLTAIFINFVSSFMISKSPYELVFEKGSDRIIALLFSKAVLFIAYKIILIVFRKNKTELKQTEWIAFCAVFVSTLISGICIYEERINGINISGNSLFILPALCLIAINIVTFYMIIRISKEHSENLRNTFLVAKIKEQETSLNEMKTMYKEMREIRHNLSNQFGCIYELIINQKYEQAKQYIEETESSSNISTIFVDTDNDIINAILSYLLNKCNKADIELKLSVFSTEIDCFSPADISVIITNLVTNAMEACQKNGSKEITLELFSQKNYYCIRVKNLIFESVLKNNPKLETTKPDKQSHGFGIISVKKLAEKYEGISNFSEIGGYFTSEIWLKFSK